MARDRFRVKKSLNLALRRKKYQGTQFFPIGGGPALAVNHVGCQALTLIKPKAKLFSGCSLSPIPEVLHQKFSAAHIYYLVFIDAAFVAVGGLVCQTKLFVFKVLAEP